MAENVNTTTEVKDGEALGKRISFALFFTASHCNPNGDPLMGNQPRQNPYTNQGIVSAECIKNKVRKCLMWKGEPVLIQPDSHPLRDDFACINDRAKSVTKGLATTKERRAALSQTYTDVRLFGCTVADKPATSITGPVTMSCATSIDPVLPDGYKLTKSTNGTAPKKKEGKEAEAAVEAENTDDSKSSDTMGYRNQIAFGLYMLMGGVTPETARATNLKYQDMDILKECLLDLFKGDATSARPEGSMEVCKLIWWESTEMNNGLDTAKLARTVQVKLKPDVEFPSSYEDYEFTFLDAEGKPEADQSVCTIPGETREIIERY